MFSAGGPVECGYAISSLVLRPAEHGSLAGKGRQDVRREPRQAVVATVPGQRAAVGDRTHREDPAATVDGKQNHVRPHHVRPLRAALIGQRQGQVLDHQLIFITKPGRRPEHVGMFGTAERDVEPVDLVANGAAEHIAVVAHNRLGHTGKQACCR